MKDEKMCEVINVESGMKNIYIDSNSQEGKLLVEVVEKHSTMQDNN